MSTHFNTRRNNPDAFTRIMNQFFGGVSKHVGFLVLTVGILFLSGVGGAYWMGYRDKQEMLARNALYLAEKSIADIYAQMDKKETDSSSSASKGGATQGGKKSAKDKSPTHPRVTPYSQLDVDQVFSDAIQKLSALDEEFKSTRVAFEARLKLGNLYFNHGNPQKGREWFEKATEIAPRNAEKALALGAQAYALENLNKQEEAVQIFQRAIDLGDGSSRDDFLMASARCYEKLQDHAQARRLYDQVLTEFPHSEISRTAEIFKNRLQ